MFNQIKENLRSAKLLDYTYNLQNNMYLGDDQIPPSDAKTELEFSELFIAHLAFLMSLFVYQNIHLDEISKLFDKEITKESVKRSFALPAALFLNKASNKNTALKDLSKIIAVEEEYIFDINQRINSSPNPVMKIGEELIETLIPQDQRNKGFGLQLSLVYPPFISKAS